MVFFDVDGIAEILQYRKKNTIFLSVKETTSNCGICRQITSNYVKLRHFTTYSAAGSSNYVKLRQITSKYVKIRHFTLRQYVILRQFTTKLKTYFDVVSCRGGASFFSGDENMHESNRSLTRRSEKFCFLPWVTSNKV